MLSSKTPRYRLLQGYIKYRGPDGIIYRGRVKLDTHSNNSYSLPCVSTQRNWRPWEKDTKVKGINGSKTLIGKPFTFTIIKNQKPIFIDTNEADLSVFSDGTVALLSAQHMKMLGIDLNHALSTDQHIDIKYIDNKDDIEYKIQTIIKTLQHISDEIYTKKQKCKVRENTGVLQQVCLHEQTDLETHLSDKIIRNYLQVNKNEFEKLPITDKNIKRADMNSHCRGTLMCANK